MGTTNIQYSNVGNLGDILKHAALVKLLRLMKQACPDKPINYLDTHTFLLEAPCANKEWKAQCDRLMTDHPEYRDYVELERRQVEAGRYWCSTRLALEVLGAPPPNVYLSEGDPETRRELLRQLGTIKFSSLSLRPEMLDYTDTTALGTPGPLLALVDPFFETEEQWERIWAAACRAIELLHAPDAPGAVLVFNWRETKDVTWPKPPRGFEGPVAEVCQPTENGRAWYHLAQYAAGSIRP